MEEEKKAHEVHLFCNAVKSETFNKRDLIDRLQEKLTQFTEKSSDFVLDSINYLDIQLVKYQRKPRHTGHSYIPLPAKLKHKKAVINVENKDDMCFMYAILSILHKDDIPDHNYRPSKYIPFMDELDFTGINFPFKVSDMKRFHKQNKTLGINLLRYAKNRVKVFLPAPLDENRRIINILLIEN